MSLYKFQEIQKLCNFMLNNKIYNNDTLLLQKKKTIALLEEVKTGA